ncbi:MAG: UDP-N-acetylmuramate dehydrogenase [Planctomycetota bacterium]|jgi:UDP-N-acetylmuramate dehydrogenase
MKKAAGAEQSFEMMREEKLSERTSFGIGGAVDYFLVPQSAAGAKSAISFCRERGLSFFVLGGGTNVLAADDPLTSAVIYTGNLHGCEIEGELVLCGAGEPLGRIVRRAAETGLSGMEPLVGIPGTVGGACWMNAGGKAGSIGDIVEEIETVTFAGRLERLPRERLRFGYRRGPFRRRIITSVVLRLKPNDPDRIFATMREILAAKRITQPLGARSAGCVFKNPAAASAGELIDKAGLKGLRCGDAEISRRHANFIVNLGGASAGDVTNLMDRMARRVFQASRCRLKSEIVFLK